MTHTPSNPSRVPSDYSATRHIKLKMDKRNIGFYEIQQAIKNGDVRPDLANDDHETVFVLTMPGVDLWVVVDVEDMTAETVYYDDEQGARGGRL